MNFLNTDQRFQRYEKPGIEFYYFGEFDMSIESIIYFLENNKFPNNLKGNFAFFYKDNNRVILAVDHAPTMNLFYTENEVSSVFHVLKNPQMLQNLEIEMQSRYFRGASYGTATSVHGINRLVQGTYFEKNILTGRCSTTEYIDLYNHDIDESVTLSDIGDIVEKVIDKNTNSKFNLLYSSGTDSNCILGFLRKLKKTDLCTLISLDTEGGWYSEKKQIDEILKIYNLQTTYHKIGRYVGKTSAAIARYNDPNESLAYKTNFERIFAGNYYDSTIWQKFESLYDTENLDKITLTGEIGDELFGPGIPLKMIRYIIQNPKFTAREIAVYHLSVQIFRNAETFVKEYDQWLVNVNADQHRLAAWENSVEYFIKLWERVNKEDLFNAGKILQYHLMAPWRLMPYTQFNNVNFFHPFQDYRLYFLIWKIPGVKLFNSSGIARKGSYEIIKDYITPLPWQLKKIGPGYVALEDRLNKFREKS